MTTDTDRLILLEYTEWAANRTPDSSIEAFLAEREAEHNTRRIAEVLSAIDSVPESATQGDLQDLINVIDTVLTSDRDYVIDTTMTGPPRRTFT